MHHMLNPIYLIQDIVRQDAILSHHVDMPHGPSGSELEQRVHIPLQDIGLILNRVTDRLHHEKQEKRDGDQNHHDGQSQLASKKIA
jgi:hypothetical protein